MPVLRARLRWLASVRAYLSSKVSQRCSDKDRTEGEAPRTVGASAAAVLGPSQEAMSGLQRSRWGRLSRRAWRHGVALPRGESPIVREAVRSTSAVRQSHMHTSVSRGQRLEGGTSSWRDLLTRLWSTLPDKRPTRRLYPSVR